MIERKISVEGIEIENIERFTYTCATYMTFIVRKMSARIAKALASLIALEKL